MIFVGYHQKYKGYKPYNPNEGNIMISRDVEFDEGVISKKYTYDFIPFTLCFLMYFKLI